MKTTTFEQREQRAFRAGVNESGLFKSIQHIFSSSFTVLAELMQNSRRAGANYVDFTFDPEAASLTITDDGSGIADFAKLVQLCESGWEDDIKISDNPFGMGFFAAFFAADQLTIKSNGFGFTLTLEDIQSKRELIAKGDATAPTQGTSITLNGLKTQLLVGKRNSDPRDKANPENYELHQRISEFARGFAIDVRFNGASLPRPHAQELLSGRQNQYGFISCAHVHDGRGANSLPGVHCEIWGGYSTALYLQGLPIQVQSHVEATAVVHLDTQLFTPVVPDRTHLFDANEKLATIRKEILQVGADFMAQQKATLEPEQFASCYWQACAEYGTKHLLNDIPVIPTHLFHKVNAVSKGNGEMWTSIHRASPFVTLQEIKEGALKVWVNEPDGVQYQPGHGAILKVMQRNTIVSIVESNFDAGHWIHRYALDCSDLQCKLETAPVKKTVDDSFADSNVSVQYVDWVKVTLTSRLDPAFCHVELIDNDWLMEPWMSEEDRAQGYTDSEDMICYVMEKDESSDTPLDALEDWEDDHGYNEAWRSNCIAQWKSLVASIRGQSLAQATSSQIQNLGVTVTPDMVGKMMLVVASTGGFENSWRFLKSFDLEAADKWVAFHRATQDAELDAMAVKALFLSTFTSD